MSDSSGEGKDSTKATKKRDDGIQEASKPKKSKSTRDKDAPGSSKGSKPKREGSAATVVKEKGTEEARQKSKTINETFHTKAVSLADFQKLKEIGKGAIGKVYLVRMKGTEELYAMKMIKKYDMVQRNKVKRILTEREILATADHPFIVSLYYSFQSQHSLVFIMEYCAGGEFYRLIQRQPFRCLKEEDARFYAAEVLSALEYLHKMGFIYRDLKPENVLVHASGHLVLTDFDLSKGSSAPVQPKVITKMFTGAHGVVYQPDVVTNSFVGTEEYLAPEVVAGTSHNATVDWWTFGILLYEMLYGTTPFRGTTRDDTFTNIRKTYIDFPEHKRGGVSKECKKILKHLLDRDPQKRLGAVGGATDIKDHAFFEPMKSKWSQLHLLKPPIIPTIPPLVIDEKLQQEDAEEEIDTDKLSKDHLWKDFGNLDLVNEDDPETIAQAEKDKEREKDKDKDKDKERDKDKDKDRSRKDRTKSSKAKDRDTDSESEESEEKDRERERSEKRARKEAREDEDDERKASTPKPDKKKERKDKDKDENTKDEMEKKEKKEKKEKRADKDKDKDRDNKEKDKDKDNNQKADEKERSVGEKADDREDAEPKEKKEKRTDGEKKDKVEKTDSAKKEKREKTDAERQEKKERKERKEREEKAD